MNRALYMREYMRRRRAETDTVNTCPVCGGSFTARRRARFCSPKCRLKAHRETLTVNTPDETLTVNTQRLAVAWRYRMADNYAAGTVSNKAGPIDRASVEASLREQFGRDVIELDPCV